jgi:putative ABC transport system permease protein
MNFSELFRIAAQALSRHKMRSFLTLLGVIIGVATVVAVVSVISGLNSFVANKLLDLNPDVLVFTKYGIIRSHNEWIEARKRKDLTYRDMLLVEKACGSCDLVGAERDTTRSVRNGSRTLSDVAIQGTTANMDRMTNLDLEEGRFFTPSEVTMATNVAVIGYAVKDELFPNQDPIGRTMDIQGYPVRIIGLQTKKGKVLGQDRDKIVMVPLTFYQRYLFRWQHNVAIFVHPRGGMAGIPRTEDEVRAVLRATRRTPFAKEDPFSIVTAAAAMAVWRSISAGAFGLMILISGISLFVGAIVIANIMFVSVVERTKEIGVRMALGARRRDVLRQFILEAALLSAVGGVIGVLIGSGIAFAVSIVFPARVRIEFILMGVGMATLVGVLAGLAPASKASRLPPVEALRFE